MALFLGEICSQEDPVLFSTLQQRLIELLNDDIRAGKFTERALARRAGLSQPHVHNLLKRVRSPTAESADALLRAISAGVRDLIEQPYPEIPAISVPILRGAVGPGGSWEDEADDHAQVACKLLAGISQPAIVRILADGRISGTARYALVDLRIDLAFAGPDLYVVVRTGEARLRYLRFGRDLVYFPTSANLNRPCEWESAPNQIDLAAIVRARVCYLEESCGPAASS